MSKSVVLPKDVWEAMKTIRLFCGTHVCASCPMPKERGMCVLHENAENWMKHYVPVDSNTITLKEEEENVE